MPELPEVETLKIGLYKYLVGHKILDIEIKSTRIFRDDKKQIIGAKIKDVRRFAKVLVFDLSNGKSIITHVKLTGQLIYRGPNLKEKVELSKKVGSVPGPHTRVVFKLDRGGILYYNDLRQFGWIKIFDTKDVETSEFVGKLGPEPFKDLDLEKFREILSKSKTAIKVVLMDQARIGGIGNIYANDSLWMSKIDPKKSANSLDSSDQKELYDNIIAVLKEGIKYGGASELQFVTAEGKDGGYQNHFRVYAQKGKLCQRCKTTKIEKYYLGGRGTFFCPVCQL
ncbi:MAG TPA: bifunctional DNA-formamidopyrimidine glycosylase/DNA-(apurinic or apyrimidinic site) lyase [Candidatus Limnocylindrales bacterium]|nr:bifunctional DNA-formamidopyrimidine glycosylase/DNA-(apurinic or apyrimidinic site) lyase [Candidatus Limnocylindrales bacterium]